MGYTLYSLYSIVYALAVSNRKRPAIDYLQQTRLPCKKTLVLINRSKVIGIGTLESDNDAEEVLFCEEQLNIETFLKCKDLKGHWDAIDVQYKKTILVLSSSQLIIMQPTSDNKWAEIKARR